MPGVLPGPGHGKKNLYLQNGGKADITDSASGIRDSQDGLWYI